MNAVTAFFVAITVAFTYSVAMWQILRHRDKIGWAIVGGLGTVVLLTPVLIPSNCVIPRAFACLFCVDQMFRTLDFARQSRHPDFQMSFLEYIRFLVPFPFLLVVFGQHTRRIHSQAGWLRDWLQFVLGAFVFSSCLGLLHFANRTDAMQSSFFWDHLAKVAIFTVAVEALAHATCGLERTAGFDTTLPIRNTFRSTTVADFWLRFNTRVQAWLKRTIFHPSGGRRHPVRGVFLVFLFSAAFHELGFGIATSKFTGYQLVFFMSQIPAVLLSPWLLRFSRNHGVVAKTGVRCLTILWMAATSVFFLHDVNRVFPFIYASQPWLP